MKMDLRINLRLWGMINKFVHQGDVNLLYKENNLDPEGIARAVIELNK